MAGDLETNRARCLAQEHHHTLLWEHSERGDKPSRGVADIDIGVLIGARDEARITHKKDGKNVQSFSLESGII